MSDALPLSVQQFIAEHIRSIAQLELLLMLSRDRQKEWTVEDAAKALYTAASMTEPLLESLRASGLVTLNAHKYRYDPKAAQLDNMVSELGQHYQMRRVSVINVIYSAPVDKMQKFADAFRIRKPPED